MDPGKKIDFLGIFPKNFDFFRQFLPKKSIFESKFPKNFDFFHVISQKIPIFKANFWRISIF